MRGIKTLTMFSRKVSFLSGSRLDLRAPDLHQRFNAQSAGDDGDDGKHGVPGPTGSVSCHDDVTVNVLARLKI